jgi:hypothetical protein
VREAGFDPVPEMMAARALGQLADSTLVGVVLDLETPGIDASGLMAALPAVGRPTVIAFGPHVQTAKLDGARAAGCDAVFTRGQITSSAMVIGQVLSQPREEPPAESET